MPNTKKKKARTNTRALWVRAVALVSALLMAASVLTAAFYNM